MVDKPYWRSEGGTALTANEGALRLVVQAAGGQARYQVLEHLGPPAAAAPVLLATGTEASVGAAMAAAERMLDRFELRSSPVSYA